jgi:hypothetical protein
VLLILRGIRILAVAVAVLDTAFAVVDHDLDFVASPDVTSLVFGVGFPVVNGDRVRVLLALDRPISIMGNDVYVLLACHDFSLHLPE